jgi:hypothetical protein
MKDEVGQVGNEKKLKIEIENKQRDMVWELVEWEMRGRVGSVLKCFEMFFECFGSVTGCSEVFGVCGSVLKCFECGFECWSVF